MQDDLDQLVLTERVEAVVAFLFLSTFLMAYYGPNAELIGNVKLTIWQYQAVADVNKFLESIFLFLAINFFNGVTGLLLWTTCKINCFKTLKNMQKEFWHILGIQEALLFVSVKMILIHWGHSYTTG